MQHTSFVVRTWQKSLVVGRSSIIRLRTDETLNNTGLVVRILWPKHLVEMAISRRFFSRLTRKLWQVTCSANKQNYR